jgi:hypothetical protein
LLDYGSFAGRKFHENYILGKELGAGAFSIVKIGKSIVSLKKLLILIEN